MSRRPTEDRLRVRELLSLAWSVPVVAESTGVPANTIRRWKREFEPLTIRWLPADEWSYAYLLGMYLGDGCISKIGRGGIMLRVVLDSAHPAVIDECEMAMRLSWLDCRVHRYFRRASNGVIVQSCGPPWLHAFPQHAPGRKHLRKIQLESWQAAIVSRHHDQFVRGLIHSDGCRTVNAFKTKLPSGRVAEYAYPRYFFSNLSDDIRDLFCASCDALGVRWTQSNPRNISIAHRQSVAILDEIGCAKD